MKPLDIHLMLAIIDQQWPYNLQHGIIINYCGSYVMITKQEYMTLYPLWSLAHQRIHNKNPEFDWSLSRDDFLSGNEGIGIPIELGVDCVFRLLDMAKRGLVLASADEQKFWITESGFNAVIEFGDANA